MNIFKKIFRITKESGAIYYKYKLEQRHTILFFIHFWSSPEFAPPHWFENAEEAAKHVLEKCPNAVIMDNYSGNKTKTKLILCDKDSAENNWNYKCPKLCSDDYWDELADPCDGCSHKIFKYVEIDDHGQEI